MDKDTILYISRLSRLTIPEEEKEKLINDVIKIISFVERIGEIDTEGIDENITVNLNKNLFRKDEVKKSNVIEDLKAQAPEFKDGFFKVPKVIK